MNYKDLQNISYLSQEILAESANEEYSYMNRWPYSSPYLQEERATDATGKEAKPYRPGPTGAEVRADAKAAAKKRAESGNQQGWKETTTKTVNPLITVNPGNPEDAAKVLHRTRPRQHGPTGSPIRIMGPMGADATRVGSEVQNIIRGGERNISRSRRLPPQENKKSSRKSREIVRKTKKEDFELWVNNLLDEGYDLSGYTWDELYENYQQLNEISPGLKRRAADASVIKVKKARERYQSDVDPNSTHPYLQARYQDAVDQHRRLVKAAYPPKPKKPNTSQNTGQNLKAYNEKRTTVSRLNRAFRNSPSSDQQEQVDLYDIILSHLINEEYADTFEEAQAIMVNMSEDWRESIVERMRGDEGSEDDPENPKVRSHNLALGYTASGRSRNPQQKSPADSRNSLRAKGEKFIPTKNGKPMFENIINYLIGEGYADTFEGAQAIMVNMSEEWRESICEEENEPPIEKKPKYAGKAPSGYMKTRKPTLQQMSSREKEAWRNRGIGA